MALSKGSPSKSGKLTREKCAWLLSDPKCAEKLYRLCPCRGHLAACTCGQPWHGPAVRTDLGAGKGAAGNLIGESLCLGLRAEFELQPLPKLHCRYAHAWPCTSLSLCFPDWCNFLASPWASVVSMVRLGGPWTMADPCCCHQLAWLSLFRCCGAVSEVLDCLTITLIPSLPALVEQPCFPLLTRTAHSPQGVGEKLLRSSREMCFLALLPGIALA